MANLKAGFEDDIQIWENKLFREQPVLCDGDGPINQLRRWYRQFYKAGGDRCRMRKKTSAGGRAVAT